MISVERMPLCEVLCHVCSRTYDRNELMLVFGEEGLREKLSEKITKYTPFTVNTERHLSAVICNTCAMNINSWDNYIQSCIDAQSFLSAQLNYPDQAEKGCPNESLILQSETTLNNLPQCIEVAAKPEQKTVVPEKTLVVDMKRTSEKSRNTYCIAKWCNNNAGQCNISFFRIPKDKERAEQWLYNAGRPDLLNQDLKFLHSKYLCEEHFSQNMFMNEKRKRLVWNAVPNIFPDASCHLGCKSRKVVSLNEIEPGLSEQKLQIEEDDERKERFIATSINSDMNVMAMNCDERPHSVAAREQEQVISTITVPDGNSANFSSEKNHDITVPDNFTVVEKKESFISSSAETFHSSEMIYPCAYCGEVFLVESSLIVHQTTYHPGHSVYCALCGLVEYHSKGEFLEHVCTA